MNDNILERFIEDYGAVVGMRGIAVFAVLLSKRNRTQSGFLSQTEICELTGMSRNTCIAAIKDLELNQVVHTGRGKRGIIHSYEILIKPNHVGRVPA